MNDVVRNRRRRYQGIGEPPLSLASSVFLAIKDAVRSARKDFFISSTNDSLFQFDSPATAERIRLACVDQFTQQVQIYLTVCLSACLLWLNGGNQMDLLFQLRQL